MGIGMGIGSGLDDGTDWTHWLGLEPEPDVVDEVGAPLELGFGFKHLCVERTAAVSISGLELLA